MTTKTATAPAAPVFTGRQRLVLLLLCGTQFMLALDFSILSVALPVIGADLGFRTPDLQWIITAFALPSGGLLLLFGRAADLFGRRRWFLGGMALFTAASLLGGLAWSPEVLIAARAGQGLAAAMLTPAAMSLLTTSFAEGGLRERALGINGTLLSLGFLTGVVLGGIVTELSDWRFTLLVNVPFGLLALVAAPLLVRESRNEDSPRLDLVGAVTVTGGLLSVIFGITSAEREGWTSPVTLGSLGLGIALLAVFLIAESRVREPLIDLTLLRRPSVRWGNTMGLLTFSMMTGTVFLLTLYLQHVREMSAMATGLTFAALGAAAVLGGAVSSRIVGALGVRNTLVLGLLLQGASTLSLVAVGRDSGYPLLLAATAVAGFGHVLCVVAYMITATSGIGDSEQGLATGLAYTAQQVGLTVGTPILGTVAALAATGAGSGAQSGTVVAGTHLGAAVAGTVLLAGAVLAAVLLRGAQKSTPNDPTPNDPTPNSSTPNAPAPNS